MHAILFAADEGTALFGRPGKDAGQNARSAHGETVYQAQYRQSMTMDKAVTLALGELKKIKSYRLLAFDRTVTPRLDPFVHLLIQLTGRLGVDPHAP